MLIFCIFVPQNQSDPFAEVGRKIADSNYQVQPYILARGTTKQISQMYLVLGDGKLVQLSRHASPVNAIDLLLKCYFSLTLHYPLGWKNVFRFIQVHVFKIPKENARESDFSEKAISIRNTVI